MNREAFQSVTIILSVTLATIITRFMPFLVFKNTDTKHPYIKYLGRVLPLSAIGLLVVYCLKNVNLRESPFGVPEIVSVLAVTILHYLRENTLLSISVGTVLYMFLVQFVFA